MKKRTIRILSIIMVLVMLLSVTATSALAVETDIGKGEQQLLTEQWGYETQTLEFATSTTEKFSFKTTAGIDSIVEKVILSNGDEVYNIVEGELENQLIKKANGDIYLDGNLVTIEDTLPEYYKLGTEKNVNNIMPRAQRHEMTNVCPYGQASDYNDYYSSRGETLYFEQEFIRIAEWAFVQIVSSLFSNPIISYYVGEILGEVLSYLRENHPLNDACTLYDVGYVHTTLGFTVYTGLSVIKHFWYFYANEDYTGAIMINGNRYITLFETFSY